MNDNSESLELIINHMKQKINNEIRTKGSAMF
jgi:hypothetical protein